MRLGGATLAFFMLAIIAYAHRASAQAQPSEETPPKAGAPAAPDGDGDDGEKARLRAAEEEMRRIELFDADSNEEIELIGRPLLAFGDSTRLHRNGSLWAWGSSGRPAAFLELYHDEDRDAQWIHGVTLTSPRRVLLTAPQAQRWQPAEIDFEPTAIAKASLPLPKPAARSRQMKDLARRFTAHEFWDPDRSRFELRLLVQPVHRYSDPSAGIQDAAVFIFAHGTNPEAVLLIEALGRSIAQAEWRYVLRRSSHAEIHVELDGHEAWHCERNGPDNFGRNKPYWSFIVMADIADSSAGACP